MFGRRGKDGKNKIRLAKKGLGCQKIILGRQKFYWRWQKTLWMPKIWGVIKTCTTQDDLFHAPSKITCFVHTIQDDLFHALCEITCFVQTMWNDMFCALYKMTCFMHITWNDMFCTHYARWHISHTIWDNRFCTVTLL